MLSATDLSQAIANMNNNPLNPSSPIIATIAKRTVHGTTLEERLASASVSIYSISRMFRLIITTLFAQVHQMTADRSFGLRTVILHKIIHKNNFLSNEFKSRILRVLITRPSPSFPEPMTESDASLIYADIKQHILQHIQIRLETALFLSLQLQSALNEIFRIITNHLEITLNKWVHAVITHATGVEIDLSLVSQPMTGDSAAFLFGATYEYNSNEIEFNRMSATISHYIAQHLVPNSEVISAWQQLWTPASIQTAVALELSSPDRPWSNAMKYTLSHIDRSNITNVIVLSELTYMMYTDYRDILQASHSSLAPHPSPSPESIKIIIDLLRTNGMIHAIRITRNIEEDELHVLRGLSVYMNERAIATQFSSWMSVCARIRKSLRDREHVEDLLHQMRTCLATGIENLPTVTVERGTSDTLMVEDWVTDDIAVALNGDRRPEVLIRVADYERMLLHGTAENPFDRRDVTRVEVVRIILDS
jgi:hypothetical protein